MGLSNADVLIGLEKALGICRARSGQPMYDLFRGQAEPMHASLGERLKNTRLAEQAWHSDVGETRDVVERGSNAYLKWRDMVLDVLPGADLVEWEQSDATPDEVEIGVESILALIEEHAENLPFAQAALEELRVVSAEMDKELSEDRQAYRAYRQAVDAKNEVLVKAEQLFLRIRRFVRRDLGPDSVEYGQLKTRAVRDARQEAMPSKTAPQAA